MKPKHAQITWQDGRPVSLQFDDIYFSQQDGMAETHHVFINGNRLSTRLPSSKPFTVAETGFGTGANWLCLQNTFAEKLTAQAPLHFISTERFPLRLNQLQQALAALPTPNRFIEALLQQYPPLIPGMHRLIFDQGKSYLTLCIGDAAESFAQLNNEVPINAWFLDGFSPAKNPEMWSCELFQQIARLSIPETTLATFTAAGFVRRALAEEGFNMQKQPGFGRKREMLTGTFNASTTPRANNAPWFKHPHLPQRPQTAIIIGAGLAGCSSAEALARRGVHVQLIEQHEAICQEASGNRQGALYAKLPAKPTLAGELHLCGLEYTLRQLALHNCLDGKIAAQSGLLQLAHSPQEAKRQQQLLANDLYSDEVVRAVTSQEASQLAGTTLTQGGLYFPRAGWVSPVDFCQRMIDHPLVKLHCNTQVERLFSHNNRWTVSTSNGDFSADIIIIANAAAAKQLAPCHFLPVKPIRGQVSVSPLHTPDNPLPKRVICGEGYVSPAVDGQLCFGATFDLHDQTPEVRLQDHEANRQMLSQSAPELAAALPTPDEWHGKVAHRCSTPDYLPIAGPVPDTTAYQSRYAKLSQDRNWPFEDQPPPLLSGLYLNIGHGSKGLITAPLCAEHLASLVCSEPLPVTHSIMQALHPARFIIRDLIRKKPD